MLPFRKTAHIALCAFLLQGFCVAQTTPVQPASASRDNAHKAPSKSPAEKACDSLLPKLKAGTHVPILFPTWLPPDLATAAVATPETLDTKDYGVSLSFALGEGDAGFAAFIEGETDPDFTAKDYRYDEPVKLVHGINGYFRPVSCGGSCAPANLWWHQNGITYDLQLEFNSTTSDATQKQLTMSAANSAIQAGPR